MKKISQTIFSAIIFYLGAFSIDLKGNTANVHYLPGVKGPLGEKIAACSDRIERRHGQITVAAHNGAAQLFRAGNNSVNLRLCQR